MRKISPTIAIAYFSLYPLAWLAACFTAGIFIGNFLNFSWAAYLSICLIFASLTLIFIKRSWVTVFLFLSFISLGSFCFEVEKHSIAPDRLAVLIDSGQLNSGDPYEITGIAEGKPELAVGGFFLILQAEKIKDKNDEKSVSGKIRYFFPVRDEEIANEYNVLQIGYGTILRISAELVREERFQNPGVISAREILKQQGIDATAVVKSPLLVENLGQVSTFLPVAWGYERRQNLIIEFKKRFSVSTAGVMIASLLGNKFHLDKTTSESFREGGTFHILVISGLQITFIGGLTILLLRQFTKNRFWQFLISSVFLWIYTIAVGADPPVLRAAIMFSVTYFAYVVYRQGTLLNTLALSALLLLVWKPSDLLNQSFQLTFMCVFAIVGMSLPLLEKLNEIGSWQPNIQTPYPPNVPKWLKSFCEILYWSEINWRKELARSVWHCNLSKSGIAEKLERLKLQKPIRFVVETIIVSLIVQAWLLPFAIVYFHRISLVSIILNVWVGLLIAIESLMAVLSVILAQISDILAAPFIWLTEIINWLILNVTIFFVEQNWSSYRLPHYAGGLKIIYFLYFIPIIAMVFILHQWFPIALRAAARSKNVRIAAFAAFFCLTFVIVFHPFSSPQPDGKLHIDFLDVGQGDSTLITMPTGETLLLDGGGKANFNQLYVQRDGEEPEPFEPDVQNIGETVVSNFLWEKGYSKINYLIPTHADTDHIQGLIDVARNFEIDAALLARKPTQDSDYAEFSRILEKRGIPNAAIAQGDVLNFGEVRIEILSPRKDENPEAGWGNDDSVVLRIIYGETKILLTADIEKQAERELLQSPEFIQANVVKVPHHGSKTSSTQEFIEAVKAKLAVISVGNRSQFGHPNSAVVNRWENSKSKIMRTGEKGTITITSDGKNLSVKTFVR